MALIETPQQAQAREALELFKARSLSSDYPAMLATLLAARTRLEESSQWWSTQYSEVCTAHRQVEVLLELIRPQG